MNKPRFFYAVYPLLYMNRETKIDKTMEFQDFRIVFKKKSQITEFDLTFSEGIPFTYLEPLYSRMADWFSSRGSQLLIVMPTYRLQCKSVPIYTTQDFDKSSSFDFDEWFKQYELEVVYKQGKIRKVKG